MGYAQHDLPQLFLLLDAAPNAEQGHMQGRTLTPDHSVVAMHHRGLEVGDDDFATSMANWSNSQDAMLLREQMSEDIIRPRGHTCRRLGHPLEHYFPAHKGSVHMFDDTAIHYNRSKTKPKLRVADCP